MLQHENKHRRVEEADDVDSPAVDVNDGRRWMMQLQGCNAGNAQLSTVAV